MQKRTYKIIKEIRKIFDRGSPIHPVAVSLFSSIIIAAITLILGWKEKSLFYEVNGLIAITDVINSIILFSAIEYSEKAPDVSYNYGYGKYESLGIFVSSSLITLIAIYTIYETINSFKQIIPIGNYEILVAFSLFSIALMYFNHRLLFKSYQIFKFQILKYDSDLWKYDAFVETGVVLNLAICLILDRLEYSNFARILDTVGAVALIGLALRIPLKYGKKSIDQLLDRTLPEKFHYDILSVIAENFHYLCEFKKVNARQSGRDIFVEIDVVLPFDLTLEEAYKIEEKIIHKIQELYPDALPRVYVVPCVKDCIHKQSNSCPVRKWQKIDNIEN